MSESDRRDLDGPHDGETGGAGYEPTGSLLVDSALESLDGLEDRPVSEHHTVLESAHERLRGALAGAADDQHSS